MNSQTRCLLTTTPAVKWPDPSSCPESEYARLYCMMRNDATNYDAFFLSDNSAPKIL